jgi:hypothetical protein
VNFRGRIVFIFPAIVSGRALDPDFGRVEIGPASARLVAQRAVALVDEVRSLCHFDPDLTAETGKFQHYRSDIRRSARLIAAVGSNAELKFKRETRPGV